MVSRRVCRLSGELQKEIASILSREIKDPRLTQLSVVSIDIAPDGCSARVYLSPMAGVEIAEQDIVQALDKAKGYIRRELAKRLKTRAVPELYFYVDQSIAYGVAMIDKINKQIQADEAAAQGRPPIEEGVYKES